MAGRPAGGGADSERLRQPGGERRGERLRRGIRGERGPCRDIQAAEAAARDYDAGTGFTVEGMEYLPRGSHPFAEGECNFTVTVRKDGAAQEDRLIQLDRTETGWTVVNEGY